MGIVFPGGADSPYQEKLQGEGNRVIRQFVEEGGWYLGFCAGLQRISGPSNVRRNRIDSDFSI